MRFKKFVKLTNHTCACNDLTNFECEAQATGNGSYVKLQKHMEKLVKSPGVNLFSADFAIWIHCAMGRPPYIQHVAAALVYYSTFH